MKLLYRKKRLEDLKFAVGEVVRYFPKVFYRSHPNNEPFLNKPAIIISIKKQMVLNFSGSEDEPYYVYEIFINGQTIIAHEDQLQK